MGRRVTNDDLPTPETSSSAAAEGIDEKRSLRVFVSYSHQDRTLAREIANILRDAGMDAMLDESMQVGEGFHDQIKNFISHAHIFLPVLTKGAGSRKWVQQEIGYAVAMRVPVAPVAVGSDPGEFLHGIQAIRVDRADAVTLRERLTEKSLRKCLDSAGTARALYECADTTDERAVLLAEYANSVIRMDRHGCVRQAGGLSSFHIPAHTIGHEAWQLRYGRRLQSEYHRKVLREERRALARHAEEKGCKLIIDPDLRFEFYGPCARLTRLESICSYLESMPDSLCEVALSRDLKESLTIVGDWFVAKSISGKPGQGYRQTIFTRHAPTIEQMIDEFDTLFRQKLGALKPRESRLHAIDEIMLRILALEKDPEQRRQPARK